MLFVQRDKAINIYSLTCSICILIVIFINRIHDALLCIIRILVVIHRPQTNTRSNEGNKIFTAPTKSVKNCEGSETTKMPFGDSVTYEAGTRHSVLVYQQVLYFYPESVLCISYMRNAVSFVLLVLVKGISVQSDGRKGQHKCRRK